MTEERFDTGTDSGQATTTEVEPEIAEERSSAGTVRGEVTEAPDPARPVRKFRPSPDGLRWQDVPLKQYKPAGTHFKDITRQILFGEAEQLPTQLRYFEIAPSGHSTLERHEHVHAVLILSGRGRMMVGDAIYDISPFDLVHIPPHTWHQFRAAAEESLGFLCLVACDRDRPARPDTTEVETLSAIPGVREFIRL